ncbi:MAG: TylF/MycF/NovP-related O-methyltransferase [Pseudomonadota bacterium]|nr:TylF/MycF/NovP-related O-methyltransferase [Pseudomonadota bacterium]
MSNIEQETWDQYNGLMLGPDIERIRKMLVRYDLFRQSLCVPGDIVECGVFKGVGAMYWAKLLAIYAPGSRKRVIGFDTFSEFANSMLDYEREAAEGFTSEASFVGIDPSGIISKASAAGLDGRLELIVGDVAETALKYAQDNKGFRVSLLHLDLDTYLGTKAILEALYDRVTPGGIIVCDEYGSPEWGESDAIDEFLKDRNVMLKTVEFSAKPTAYFTKLNH